MLALAGRCTTRVPTLARLYGIVIAMFYREHNLPTSMLVMVDGTRRLASIRFSF